jgi:hypothetical protein
MKNKLTITIIFVLLTVPNLAFASWWNPFSWSWFTKTVKMDTSPAAIPVAITPITEELTSTSTTVVKADESIVSTQSTEGRLMPTKAPPAPVSTKLTPGPCDQECLEHQESMRRNREEMIRQEALMLEQRKQQEALITEKAAIQDKKNNNPRAVAIRSFLDNPTFTNFKLFCEKAKSLDGWTTKQTLDEQRESIVTVTLSLYDDINCEILKQDITVYQLPDDSLSIPYLTGDTDTLRTVKIKTNESINSLTTDSKFVIFKNPYIRVNKSPIPVPDGVDPHSFRSVTDHDLQYYQQPKPHNIPYAVSLYSPVKILTSMRAELGF